jgi:hypothetical protein
MPQCWWLLEPRPLTTSISQVDCCWWFGEEHQFDRLALNTRTVADPAYLAERLATGVDAVHLTGWQDGDAEATHRWLLRRRATGAPPRRAVMRDDRVRWSGALVILRSIDRRGLQQTLNAMGAVGRPLNRLAILPPRPE